jgi:hypothetical protein
VTNDTDSFVNEVDESLRQDRITTFLRQWGLFILAGFAAIILAVVAWQVWRAYSVDQARNAAEAYAAAQTLARDGDLDGAKTAFEGLRETGPRVYRVMAHMELAAVLQAQGDLEAALTEFDAAAEKANDPIMRLSAQMRAAYIAADTADFDTLQTRLTPIIESESRFSYLARELLAMEAWEAGQNDLARDTLEALTLAFDAPEAVRQRAQVALSVIGPAPQTSADGAAAPAPSEGDNQ